MSRHGYDDNYGDDDHLALARYRSAVTRSLQGKRGQLFLRELIASLDALPVKRLIKDSFVANDTGEVCALGAVGKSRGLNLEEQFEEMIVNDDIDAAYVGVTFGIAESMAREIMWENDEGERDETPEQRWARVRRWAEVHLIEWMPE
jgi:hypothetical protein